MLHLDPVWLKSVVQVERIAATVSGHPEKHAWQRTMQAASLLLLLSSRVGFAHCSDPTSSVRLDDHLLKRKGLSQSLFRYDDIVR